MATRVPLKELCTIEITDGTHKTPTYSEKGYIFLSSKNVTSGKIDWDNVMYIPENLHLELHQRLAPQKDDILLAKNGTTGVAAIVDRDVVFDIYVSLALIRPNQKMVIPKYLLYAINSDSAKRYFNRHLKGIGVPNLHLTHIRETPISVPNFDTQRQIITKLDKVSDLIAKRRQQLGKLDEMVKARFVEMFGDRLANNKKWNNKSLEKCAVFYNGKAHEQVVDENGQYIMVTSKFIASGQKEYRRTNELLFPLYRGDICMVMSDVPNGRALAKCVLIDQDNKFTLNQRICCFRDYNMNSIFLFYVLNRHEYFLSFDDGDSQTNLRKNDILACPIILPPIELQNQFAAFVEQTEKTKTTISRSLEKLETLKKALMQEYFG